MKVSELIEELSNFDGDMEVHFAYDYGDHWHSQVAPKVKNAEEGYVKFSDYHRMPKVIEQSEDDYEEGKTPEGAPVVILNYSR